VAASGLEFPESVDESRGQDLVEALPFLVGKARVTTVGPGVGQVDFLVGNIEVATEDHRFLFFQAPDEFQELNVPLVLAVVQAGQFALGVGCVDGDQEKIVEFGGEHPAFGIQFGQAQARINRPGNLAGQQGSTGISPFQGGVPVHRVTRQIKLHLLWKCAHLLQADHIRVAVGCEIQKTFFDTGPQAVHVPGNQLHGGEFQSFEF